MLEEKYKELIIKKLSKIVHDTNHFFDYANITEDEIIYFLDFMDWSSESIKNVFGWGKEFILIRLWEACPNYLKTEKIRYKILSTLGFNQEITDETIRQILLNFPMTKYVYFFIKDLINDEIWKWAFSKNLSIIEIIPEKLLTRSMVITCVVDEPSLVNSVPYKYQNNNTFEDIIEANPEVLKYMNQYLLLRFAPPKEEVKVEENQVNKGKSAYETAFDKVKEDGTYIERVFAGHKTLEFCIEAIKNGGSIKYVPEKYYNAKQLVKIARERNQLVLIRSGYDTSINQFRIIEMYKEFYSWAAKKIIKGCTSFKDLDECCLSFVETRTKKIKKYLDFFDNKLVGDFTGYDFNDIDLKKYDISEAYIDDEVLIKNGMYDANYYKENVENGINISYELSVQNNEIIMHDDARIIESDQKIYYISDIHLNHKIIDKYGKTSTKNKIEKYIDGLVKELVKEAEHNKYLIIAGDVASSFELVYMFYSSLTNYWDSSHIIAILGNHELWAGTNYHDTVNKYKAIFRELGIILLQNDLLIRKSGITQIIEEDILKHIETEELIRYCMDSELTIFGGIGFSGYTKKFNASNGLYKQCITSAEEELVYTKEFEDIYRKIVKISNSRKVIIATHMPKESFTQDEYTKNCVYISGHTHNNFYKVTDNVEIYSDNQIGYWKKTMFLKSLYISGDYDIFDAYNSGIYKISREEYVLFNRGKGIKSSFSRKGGQIYMIKNANLYMFVYENEKKTSLCILNGGQLKKMEIKEIKYYYDHLINYANLIEKTMRQYNKAMENISAQIRKFGGTGIIHGCIVDIDYYNHIYLNPLDGKIRPYYADMMTSKIFYDDVGKLLKNHNKKLHDKYKECITIDKKNQIVKADKKSKIDSGFDSSTEMYQPSRLFKQIQYLTEKNIVRVWIEDVVTKKLN